MERRRSAGTAGAVRIPLAAVAMLGGIAVAGARGEGAPARASELFSGGKVWTLHLRFAPEQWAAMEPAGGKGGPFTPGVFGLGMFLMPPAMRDGDKDRDGRLSAGEFRDLGAGWFTAWDADGDGRLDAEQVRAGLKGLLAPPGGGPGDADRDGGPPPGLILQGRAGQRNGLSALMGVEFEYVRADLEFEGRALRDVAVRYKGNGTFLESRSSIKRSLKIDLNEHVKGQKLAGVSTLNLHNNVTDAGMMQESLAYRLYRDAGVPAPRTAYARVYVTVPGQHDRRYFGLYTLVENVDRDFFADRKLAGGGAIFKPSTPDVFSDQGDDWSAYNQSYDPKTDLTDAQERRIIDLCRLVSRAGDAAFAAQIGEFVDLDELARFLAVSAWIGDLDSILTTGQNYYLWLDPKGGRLRFIPWDKDHTFGSWVGGTYAERVGHSIRQPWEGRKRFLERVFAVEAFRSRYLAAMATVANELATPDRIEGQVKELAAAIRPAVAEEPAPKLTRFEAVVAGKPLPGAFLGFGPATPTMLMFVKERAESVRAQLAGRDEGIVMGRPKPADAKGGPPPPGPPPFEEMIEPALMRAFDADKDGQLTRDEFVGGFDRWFAGWDTAHEGRLAEDRVRKGLNLALPFPFPGFGPRREGEAKPGADGPPTGGRAPEGG